MKIMRIVLLTFLVTLTVGLVPALAEKKYKKSCQQYCVEKVCIYGVASRPDMTCNARCEARCIQQRADKNRSG
jgi:hypothetical protein